MNFSQLIKKTIEKRRGYKYHTYQTDVKNSVFRLYHYGTCILEVDLEKKNVISYAYSKSDSEAIDGTIWALHDAGFLKDEYYLHRGSLFRLGEVKLMGKTYSIMSKIEHYECFVKLIKFNDEEIVAKILDIIDKLKNKEKHFEDFFTHLKSGNILVFYRKLCGIKKRIEIYLKYENMFFDAQKKYYIELPNAFVISVGYKSVLVFFKLFNEIYYSPCDLFDDYKIYNIWRFGSIIKRGIPLSKKFKKIKELDKETLEKIKENENVKKFLETHPKYASRLFYEFL